MIDWCCSGCWGGGPGVGKRVYKRAQVNLEVMGLVTISIMGMISHSQHVCTSNRTLQPWAPITSLRKSGQKDRLAAQAASPICSPGCKV